MVRHFTPQEVHERLVEHKTGVKKRFGVPPRDMVPPPLGDGSGYHHLVSETGHLDYWCACKEHFH